MRRDRHRSRQARQSPCEHEGSLSPQRLDDVLHRERSAAEATLGRPLIDDYAFAGDCIAHGLGHALNREQDRVDELTGPIKLGRSA